MPYVSDEFLTWLRGVVIPEIHPFNTLTPDEALKQVAYAQGILWLKAVINAESEKNKNRLSSETLFAPKQ